MRLKVIHSRDDLIDEIRGRCLYTSANRAIDTGTVLVLGRFAPTEGVSRDEFWAVRITSRHQKVWQVAIIPSPRGLLVRDASQLDWANWMGNEQGADGLFNGDDPVTFGGLRLQAMENKGEDTT